MPDARLLPTHLSALPVCTSCLGKGRNLDPTRILKSPVFQLVLPLFLRLTLLNPWRRMNAVRGCSLNGETGCNSSLCQARLSLRQNQRVAYAKPSLTDTLTR